MESCSRQLNSSSGTDAYIRWSRLQTQLEFWFPDCTLAQEFGSERVAGGSRRLFISDNLLCYAKAVIFTPLAFHKPRIQNRILRRWLSLRLESRRWLSFSFMTVRHSINFALENKNGQLSPTYLKIDIFFARHNVGTCLFESLVFKLNHLSSSVVYCISLL